MHKHAPTFSAIEIPSTVFRTPDCIAREQTLRLIQDRVIEAARL